MSVCTWNNDMTLDFIRSGSNSVCLLRGLHPNWAAVEEGGLVLSLVGMSVTVQAAARMQIDVSQVCRWFWPSHLLSSCSSKTAA